MSNPKQNPTAVSWTDPTTNTDGSAIAAGEITGYTVGVRSVTASGSVAGTYPFTASAPASSTDELLGAITPTLPPDTYVAAVQSNSASNGNSAWSSESNAFTITAPTPAPNPPTNVSVS